MRTTLHETYERTEVESPSERSTGLLFAAVAAVISVLWRADPNVFWLAVGAAGIFAAVSLLAPALLRPLNLVWFRFGLLLHRVVSPLVMLFLFTCMFVPAGLIMRLRRDPLRSRRLAPGATSYWIEYKERAQDSMRNQF